MGKVFSMITRPVKNFNIESRAHKIISQDKPTPAPKYKANIEHTEQLLKENPDSIKELLRKNTALDSRLKDVYVKSYDPVVSKTKDSLKERPLPLNRRIIDNQEFGFHEPISVPIGRCTLRQTLKFLTNHYEDSTTWNSGKIAIEYKLPEDTIKNILHYFRIYKVYVPDKKSKIILAEPSIPRKRLVKNPVDKLIAEDRGKKK